MCLYSVSRYFMKTHTVTHTQQDALYVSITFYLFYRPDVPGKYNMYTKNKDTLLHGLLIHYQLGRVCA